MSRNVLTTINVIIVMEDELQRLHEELKIEQDRLHKSEREDKELDLERTEKFSEYLEIEKLFKENREVLEVIRARIANIREDIDSLLGP